MFQGIDLYSDTSTNPSSAMKQAMMEARLGDEQRGEDPTTCALEEMMAEKLNKRSSMFFPSATMCNQIATVMHTRPGDEVIGAEECHMFNSEAGGLGFHSGVQTRGIKTDTGIFGPDDVDRAIRFGIGAHTPRVSLLLMENTTNAGGGCVWPLPMLDKVQAAAKSRQVKIHLDGSRIFNAAAASHCDVSRLAKGFDSVTVCFSKGLGCALGAILAFDSVPREEVRRLKQIFGGAMRQSGMLAAACIFALQNHVEDILHDHRRAQELAAGLAKLPGLRVENARPESNIIFFSIDLQKSDPESFLAACIKRGVRFSRFNANRFRAVTHRDISDADIAQAIALVAEVLA